ncbi:MAG TPA: HlyC/CorC family transporter [Hellea balneolensis]|uniref:HlyC/CorC family transporter n=1 Tax=Hellea balneolensis TaxID=287478 RepID=A0A7C5QX20_9PROT|nr:HlyC/CorC family transporter [Hellea balneolensis]
MSAVKEFPTLNVEDVMVPRADIIAVDDKVTLRELVDAFKQAGHSRLPVYKDTLDEPTGMVHVKDLLPYLAFDARGRTGKTYPDKKIVSKILRPVLFAPPSMQAQDLLRKMQALRKHMAIVVDEYGGTDGIVTMEDLIEPIIGDIEDEHDGAEPVMTVHKTASGDIYWDADARVTIEDFEAEFGRDIATPEEEDDVDTLGGLVFSLAGRVPERREVVRHPFGLEFEVLDVDARRIKKLRIRALNDHIADTS